MGAACIPGAAATSPIRQFKKKEIGEQHQDCQSHKGQSERKDLRDIVVNLHCVM